jgi:hypothetical protein
MFSSQRCRDNAAVCRLAACNATEPHYAKLYLSMAETWRTLAQQDAMMNDLLASWGLPDGGNVLVFPSPWPPAAAA